MSSVFESAGRRRPSVDAPASAARHSAWTIALHWFTVLAIVIGVGAVLWRELVEDKGLRVILMEAHRQAGLLVLVALGLRLLVRWRVGMADHAGEMPRLMRIAAGAAHLALYALLLALTVLGMAASNAHAVQLKLFGLIPLPILVAEDGDLADTLEAWHLWGAWLLLALVVLHVAAAAWHHWGRRDGVLTAMLPLLQRKR